MAGRWSTVGMLVLLGGPWVPANLSGQASDKPPQPVGARCDYDEGTQAARHRGWRLAFREEFDGDLSRWETWSSGAFNNEHQYYQPANVSVANGQLTLTVRREAARGRTNPSDSATRDFAFTSGRIESLAHFSASKATPAVRIVSRLRLPAGAGLWPAFWSYGAPWPTQGEIDILEALGADATWMQTAYWYGAREGINDVVHSEVPFRASADLQQCWHVYEVTWRHGTLAFGLDGRVFEVKRGGHIPAMFGARQRVVFDVAVGGNFFREFDPSRVVPGTMHVDWVRVYTGR